MAYLVEIPVDVADGTQKIVKVEISQAAEGLVEVARPGQVVARAKQSLGEMLAGIRPVVENFVASFDGMTDGPEEIGVEFGLALSGEADILVSKASAQATFKVSLKWRRAPGGDPDGGVGPAAEHS